MDLAFLVVPVQSNTDVSAARPILLDVVVLFQDAHQMVDVSLSLVLHSKIVYHESELDRSCLMFPQARDQFALLVAVFVESLLEQLIC